VINSSPGFSKKGSDNTPLPSQFRSGFVGLIGKPNVGKSTILNALLGRKVSITSPRPQTTRYRILGILTREDAQVIFMDSPGWHKPVHRFGRHLITIAKGVIEEADVLVAIIDAVSGITREDQWVFDEVRRTKRPAILAINKIDLLAKPRILPLIETCAALKLFEEYIPTSGRTGENLTVLLTQIIARLPEGPRWFEADQITDQATEQVIQELIREQVLYATRQEVPHAAAVLLEDVTRKETVMVIRATILVEREGQKAILIGQRGQMLKRIGQLARQELEQWLGQKIFLALWVKVAKSWREDPTTLRQLGHVK